MENKPNLIQQSMHTPIKRNALQHKINTKKLKPGLVAWETEWVYSQRKRYIMVEISKEKVKKKV